MPELLQESPVGQVPQLPPQPSLPQLLPVHLARSRGRTAPRCCSSCRSRRCRSYRRSRRRRTPCQYSSWCRFPHWRRRRRPAVRPLLLDGIGGAGHGPLLGVADVANLAVGRVIPGARRADAACHRPMSASVTVSIISCEETEVWLPRRLAGRRSRLRSRCPCP